MTMQHVDISEEWWEQVHTQAGKEAREMGQLHGSIEDGDGNYAGIFGELLFVEVFGGERDNDYDMDVVYDGVDVDVKTKRRSVEPEPYYECSIADYNTEQDCEWYYFTSVLYDYNEAWLLGYLPTDEYYEKAEFHEEGDIDPDNGFRFKADCYNVAISDLKQLDVVEELPETVEL